MADPSDIKYAEQLLRRDLLEWRDAGGSVESVTDSILRLIVAREAFAIMRGAELETRTDEPPAQFFLDNEGAIEFGTPPVVTCEGCGNEIDPDTCGCGDPIKGHSYSSGHGPVPMGCDCHRASANRRAE